MKVAEVMVEYLSGTSGKEHAQYLLSTEQRWNPTLWRLPKENFCKKRRFADGIEKNVIILITNSKEPRPRIGYLASHDRLRSKYGVS